MINGSECTKTPITATAKSSTTSGLLTQAAKIVHPCAQTRRHRALFPGRHAKKDALSPFAPFPEAQRASASAASPPATFAPSPTRSRHQGRRSRARQSPQPFTSPIDVRAKRHPSGSPDARPQRIPTPLPSLCISARKALSRARCARSGRVPGARSAEGHRKRGRQEALRGSRGSRKSGQAAKGRAGGAAST